MIKRLKDALQLWCFTLPFPYCTYSPAIAPPHYCLWFTWFSLCDLPPVHLCLHKVLSIPGHCYVVKIIKNSFLSEHWGESNRLQRTVTKAGRYCGSVLLTYTHTQTDSLGHSHTQTHTVQLSQCHASHSERIGSKNKHAIPYLYAPLHCSSTLLVLLLSLCLQGKVAVRSEPSRVFNV